jgi:hypothetical protein
MSPDAMQRSFTADANGRFSRQERSLHKYYTNMHCVGLERARREFDPSLQLRGNGRRKTTGPCPGDRYFRCKRPVAQKRRVSVLVRPGFAHLPSAGFDKELSILRALVTKYA